MMEALSNLTVAGVAAPPNLNIRTTHYYVKFTPADWEQFALLHEDTNHVYFNYPLDRKIIEQGNRYKDPDIADSTPTPLYTTIEEGFQINPDIPHEILSPLYIPELDVELHEDDEDFIEMLLDEAYILTGNYEDTIKAEVNPSTMKRTYQPGGQILINDNRVNQNYGMEGVLVTARRWFTVRKGRTDFNGNYLVNGGFKRPCNYRLHYEVPGFNVRETFFNVIAYVDGPKTSSHWSTTIGQGYNNFAGHVFRGAYRYHYKNIDGLLRPFHPSLHFTNYIAKRGTQNWGSGINYGLIPIIKVAQDRSAGNEYNDDEIFSTTCHETAHLTHIILLGSNLAAYLTVGGKIRESWATAVEWWLTGIEYRMRGVVIPNTTSNYGEWNYHIAGLQFPNDYGYQYWSSGVNDAQYTSLFINCLDTYNEQGQPFPGANPNLGTVNDLVGGQHGPHFNSTPYTIKDLETKVIKFSIDLTTTSNSLKAHKPNGVTNSIIDILINAY